MFCKLPIPLIIGNLLFIHGQLTDEIYGSHLDVSHVNHSSDASAIGTYRFGNAEECNRMCWYRKLCTSYSYNHVWATNGDNCVLYAGLINAPLPPGWMMMNVDSAGVTDSCAHRPCGDADICIPYDCPKAFNCSYQPSECPIITPTPHSTLHYTTRKQDDKARVTCDENYIIVPLNTSHEIQCKVTSQWDEFKGVCAKAVFRAPIPTKMPLPLPIRNGWQGCARGVYSGNYSGSFDFLLNDSCCDIVLHIALRSKDFPSAKRIITNTYFEGSWGPREQEHGYMPLTDGDDYELSFEAQGDRLILRLLSKKIMSNNTYTIPLSKYNLSSAGYLKIDNENLRSVVKYVNLASGC